MPWMAVETAYAFEGPAGKASLLDLFDGRRQLIVYRAFFEPGVFGCPTTPAGAAPWWPTSPHFSPGPGLCWRWPLAVGRSGHGGVRAGGLDVLKPCGAVAACWAALAGLWRLALSGSSGRRGGGQSRMGEGELVLVRMRRGHGHFDAADADPDQRADLEEGQA
jgi:Bacterial protein of unknown function (DUF899)